MIDFEAAREIVGQYEKHGWTLRRVLLCGTPENFPAFENPFKNAPLAASEIDALWFSRRAANGGESWELRRLSGAPFALLKVFNAGDDEAAREKIKREAENSIRGK